MHSIKVIKKQILADPAETPIRSGAPDLKIIYSNDLHNQLTPQNSLPSFPHRLCSLKQQALMQSPTLLLAGGDDIAGSIWDALLLNTKEKKHPCYKLYQAIGMDALTLGNHDFDLGINTLIHLLHRYSELCFVATNLEPDSPIRSVTEPAVIFEFPTIRVGVMGLLTSSQCPDEVGITDPYKAYTDYYPGLKAQADCIVVLSHLGYRSNTQDKEDWQLINQLYNQPETLICGAHSHDLKPAAGTQLGQYLQSGSHANYIGQADWNQGLKSYQVSNTESQQLPFQGFKRITQIEQALQADLNALKTDWQPIEIHAPDCLFNETLGIDCYRGESAHLNFVNDVLLPESTDADMASVSGICVRTFGKEPLKPLNPMEDWYQTFPYLDRASSIDIPWNHLPRLLEINAQRLLQPAHFLEDHGWLQFDKRIRYCVELTEKQAQVHTITYDAVPFSENQFKTLRIHSNTYFTRGYGGYNALFKAMGLENFETQETNIAWKQALAEKLQKMPLVHVAKPLLDQRIHIRNGI